MKTISATKSKTDSPKTPGGISKALLTPCRRLGLSRNWKKSGPSPFQSPLSGTPEVKQEEKVEKKTRKRKESCEETSTSQDVTSTPNSLKELDSEVSTPVKNVELPRRKKSKTLLSAINDTTDDQDGQNDGDNLNMVENISFNKENTQKESITIENEVTEPISTPVRLKSKSKSLKKKSPAVNKMSNLANNEINEITSENGQNEKVKVKSPNNLTKECIVVIQKKIFKHEISDKDNKEPQNDNKLKQDGNKEQHNTKKSSQTILDSDADDIPLCQLNKLENETKGSIISIDDDDDFTISKKTKKHDTKTQIELSKPKKSNSKTQKPEIKIQNSTQNLIESDEDDDFFEKKHTIVVKKTYLKPIKAKSTGSITQKDIDDLRARIEKKKKMLLAKTLSNDTSELRELIKKWQKGCQEALIQLMDLMKTKMPSNEQMDYSNMLKVLKIPANLVGYDSENDNFITPDDESIILANISD